MTDHPTRNNIGALRKARGWSMSTLADKLHTSTSTINRLEKGAILDVTWLEKLEAVFDADWYEIAGHKRPGQILCFANDAAPFHPPAGQWLEHASFGPDLEKWEVLTPALDAIGLATGDVVLVDMANAERAGTGDSVLLQLVDPGDTSKVWTLIRQYIEPDLFVTNSRQHDASNLKRGRHEVRIMGKITKRFADIGAR